MKEFFKKLADNKNLIWEAIKDMAAVTASLAMIFTAIPFVWLYSIFEITREIKNEIFFQKLNVEKTNEEV